MNPEVEKNVFVYWTLRRLCVSQLLEGVVLLAVCGPTPNLSAGAVSPFLLPVLDMPPG